MDAPAATLRMSRDEYRRWAEVQRRRHERVRGEVIEMPAERVIHARLKARIWELFARELRARGRPGEAFPDGMTVEVGDDTDYEPDVIIGGGAPLDDEDVAVPDPVVVVEVLSPGTARTDLEGKLADYFRVPAIQHYLVVRPKPTEIIHHRRGTDGLIETRVLGRGTLVLEPPGITIELAEIFGAAA